MKQPVFLRVYRNGKLENVKQFTEDQIVIGRNTDIQVQLETDDVSPLHAVIEERDTGYYVSDLGSANGTFRNGTKIFDEKLESGDELEIGPFKIEFYVGVPKPKKNPPNMGMSPDIIPEDNLKKPIKTPPSMPDGPPEGYRIEKTVTEIDLNSEEIKTSVGTTEIPSAVQESKQADEDKDDPLPPKPAPKRADKGTYAPPSARSDLIPLMKKSEGTVVEVAVAWKERVISTHHFSKTGDVTIGSDPKSDIVLPLVGMNADNFTLLQISDQGVIVCVTPEMSGQHFKGNVEMSLADLRRKGRMVQGDESYEMALKSGEMVRLGLNGDTVSIYVRFVQETPKPLVAPILDLSASETSALIMAAILAIFMSLYLSLYSQSPLDELAQVEEPIRKAIVTFKPPKKKKITQVDTAPKQKKVVKVVEKKKKATTTRKDPGKAASLKKSRRKKTNKLASSVGKGGSVKTGAKGANARSKKRDVKNEGLLSAFGKGGIQKKLSKAYSGTGELQGLANRATGKTGANERRAGDRLGSRLKNTGGGSKGTSTEGFSGVGTKGKGSGAFGYGTGGIGEKGSVDINISGAEAEFSGTIDREAIRRVIQENKRAFKFCYDTALRRNSDLYGRIEIQWDIVERGRVRNAKVKSNSVGDKAFGNCIVGKIRGLKFPEPPPDEIARVVYPFVFAAQ